MACNNNRRRFVCLENETPPKSPASKRTDRRVNSAAKSSQCVPPLPRRGSIRPNATNDMSNSCRSGVHIVRPAIRTHPASCVINVPLSSSFVTQGCNHAMNTSWNTAHRYIGWISLIGVRFPPPPRVFVFALNCNYHRRLHVRRDLCVEATRDEHYKSHASDSICPIGNL